jgi:predicted alpha/beta hydrolase family esterase
MPRRPTRTVPTVILHGLNGAGPDHWQRWLAGRLSDAGRDVIFPELPNPDAPELAEWLPVLTETLAGLPADGYDLIGHSLGAVLWLHHAANPGLSPAPARVALVAMPSSTPLLDVAPSFVPVPLDIDTVRKAADGTVLVGGDNDPYCPDGVARTYGAPLKMAATVIPDAGHINLDSGFGPWPAVLDWCGRDNLAFIA